ncbi:MAG: hypothetical protein E7573_01425 [Ruminococcaceae bacterium]|nr:hypothetical protein [Oscillospiraceae bacterium]
MKKLVKKIIAFSLCLTLLFTTSVIAIAENDVKGQYDYTITSPYDSVDWDNWNQYKASLHSHTDASDADQSIADSVKKHYDLGYQILAISDHAVLGTRWDEVPETVPIYRFFKFSRTGMRDPVVLTSEEREQIINGTYESAERDALAEQLGYELGGMLEITGSCEANGATPINDCHINTFGCTSVRAKMGVYGDFETVVRDCDKEGGFSFLDHTGEYVGRNLEDEWRAYEPYYANKFANIFLDYDSCVAFDVNSTRYDSVIWDQILQLTIPKGRNVPGIAFSDSHDIEDNDWAFTMMLMPELTEEAFEDCMRSGAWFSVGRVDTYYLGDDFNGTGNLPPAVSRIYIDNETDTISFTGSEFSNVQWISDGKIIAEGENLTSLDLNEYEDELGCYVRFQITGPGGILYSQPFVTMADGVEYDSDVYVTFDLSMVFRRFIDIFNLTLGHGIFVTIIKKLLWNHVW